MTQRPDEARPADRRSVGSAAAQLPLDLEYRPALGRDSFLVTSANEAAVTWIDLWPDWPSSALVLAGPACCGKTHLASVWQARTGAACIDGAELNSQEVPELLAAKKHVVVEASDKAAEQPLLHLLNGITEQKKYVLLTALDTPNRWRTALGDLSSRLRALPVALIASPDDMLMQAMVMKRFADRGLTVGAEVAADIASRIERSFAAVERVVEAIDAAALAEQRAVKLAFAREVLRLMPEDAAAYPQDRH